MTPLSERNGEPPEPRPDARPEVCVLLVEARVGTASVVRTLLGASAAARFDVLRTATFDAAMDAASFGGVDVVVLGSEIDPHDPALGALLEAVSELPVIALTRSEDPQMAVDMIDAGLHDCVPATRISADALGWAVLRALHRQRPALRSPGATCTTAPAGPPPEPANVNGLGADLATDVQTPVTALVGLVELLTSAWDTLEEDQKLATLDRIGTYAGRVERLTSDLLTITSLQAEVTRPIPRHVTLAPVAEAVATQAGHDLRVQVDPDLTVWLDPDHLAQILHALASHAIQRSDGPHLVRADAGGSSVRVWVGPADAPPTLATEGWAMAVGVAGLGPEEGAGLAVARALAEANGGLAGQDHAITGAVWARVPSSPPS